MTGSDPLFFVRSLGPLFGLGFAGLTGLCVYQFLQVRQIAGHGIREQRALATETTPGGGDGARWVRLGVLRGELAAGVARAQLTLASIPTLALLGTVLGFFYAIANAGALDLAAQDPLAILDALMDGGISTALATTVLGQALYLVLGQGWAWFVAGPVEASDTALSEALSVLRDRLAAGDSARTVRT